MRRRRYADALIPDRQWAATLTLANGAQLTTTIHAPNPTTAEDPKRLAPINGSAVTRVRLHAETRPR